VARAGDGYGDVRSPGLFPDSLDERGGRILSTNQLLVDPLARFPTIGVDNGAMGFATDGRKDGEGAGAGTGIPIWFDATSSTWRTFTTGGVATE